MTASTVQSRSNVTGAPLGDVDVTAFLRRYWHKEPLLVRQAIAGFSGLFSAQDLFTLARRDDIEARLVVRTGSRWSLIHGPLRRADFKALPERNWTLLVQGVNRVSPAGDALLRRFAFLPFARLDDLMVSYAAPGGGVGPHSDSYDVFLLQGFGRRRWRFGRQDNLTLKPRLPLKILQHFKPEHSEMLAPGDMLYLPPHLAHDGGAVEACTTYSIGFRAPSTNELAVAFLDFLRDELDLAGQYADPDLAPVRAPAAIDSAMRRRYARMLDDVAWDQATIARFVGCWLSEPKPDVVFDPPRAPLPRVAFRARAEKHGVLLDLRTQLLYDAVHIFINGTALPWPTTDKRTLQRLANARGLTSRSVNGAPPETATLLYNWYRDGYLHTNAA